MLAAQNIFRTIASSNVGEHGTEEEKRCTEIKMNHSASTAAKFYRFNARPGMAANGLHAIREARKKSLVKNLKLDMILKKK